MQMIRPEQLFDWYPLRRLIRFELNPGENYNLFSSSYNFDFPDPRLVVWVLPEFDSRLSYLPDPVPIEIDSLVLVEMKSANNGEYYFQLRVDTDYIVELQNDINSAAVRVATKMLL